MKIIILAGGTGTRLWPMSRELYGKQFLRFLNIEKSLFEETYENACSLVDPKNIIIITNKNFIPYVKNSIRGTASPSIITEPLGKNTLNTIALGIKYSEEKLKTVGTETYVVFSSDCRMKNGKKFKNSIKKANEYAKKGTLSILGIVPSYPETGYGYVLLGEKIENNVFYSASFVEKPTQKKAITYIKNEKYLWNSSILCFSQKFFWDALAKFQFQIYELFKKDYSTILENFNSLPSLSISRGIMEKMKNIVVIKSFFEWNDFGSWKSIYNYLPKDEDKNVTRGDVACYNTKNSLVFSENRLVITLGINNLVVVETNDAILVANKDLSQQIKDIASDLKNKGRKEVIKHQETITPWGSSVIIKETPLYKIKILTIFPGKETDLQLSDYKNENWTIVSGKANFIFEKEENILEAGQNICTTKQIEYKIRNKEEKNLIITEIQSDKKLENLELTQKIIE